MPRPLTISLVLATACLASACPDDGVDATATDAVDMVTDLSVDPVADEDAGEEVEEEDVTEPAIRVLFDLEGGFFEAPFPIESRRRPDDTVDVSDFPNPYDIPLLASYLQLVDQASEGFSRNGSVFFTFDGPIDPDTLPQTLENSLASEASVFFLDIDPTSPQRGRRMAVQVRFHPDEPAVLRPPNLLTVLPYPGLVQRPNTLYAAVVTRGVRDPAGRSVEPPALLQALLADTAEAVDERLAEGFRSLTETLSDAALDPAEVAAATVYRTGRPTAGTRAIVAHADALEPPDYRIVGQIRDYPTYCVLEGRTTVPIYQVGDRVYSQPGTGHIEFAQGVPVVQWTEEIRFSLSIPKMPIPTAGFPLLFYAAGQGGAYTQVVDRGTSAERAVDPQNGRGPAYYLADVGIAALSIEAATVGPRHPSGSFEGLDFFNVLNLAAFRDNIRQAAAEFSVLANMAETMAIPMGDLCPGVTADGPLHFDADRFFFYGHSTGATIGHLVLGLDRGFRAGLLSGAGGSWIYNLALKQQPIDVATVVGGLLRLPPSEPLDEFHPVAMLFQMAIEPAEAMNFAPLWLQAPPEGATATDILLIEGLVDGYFLPRMVSALAMAGSLDLAGPARDPEILADLALVGRGRADLPAEPNWGEHSGYVVQFEADGFDGHYVPFELQDPKYVYKCWFDSLVRRGMAVVPALVADGEADCPTEP